MGRSAEAPTPTCQGCYGRSQKISIIERLPTFDSSNFSKYLPSLSSNAPAVGRATAAGTLGLRRCRIDLALLQLHVVVGYGLRSDAPGI